MVAALIDYLPYADNSKKAGVSALLQLGNAQLPDLMKAVTHSRTCRDSFITLGGNNSGW